MATIASLIIRIGADASTVRSTLNRTARDLQQFARNASRLRTTDVFGNLPANLNRNVTRATTELNRLRQEFARTMTDLRQRSAEGTINERQFFRDGQRAEEAFNRGVLAARRRFGTGNRSAGVDARISAGILAQLKNTSGPARDLTQQLSVVGDLSQSLGRTLTRGLTLPIVGFGIAGVKAAGDFQAALNQAGALVEDSRGKIDRLADAALKFAQISPFGPAEIAKSMATLGQAGLKTEQVLSTLPGIIRLATIEHVSLDQAVETVVRSMTALGLKASATEAFVDKMAKASLSGTVNMTELGDAFRYAATVAAQSGQPLEDILALITKLAQGGLPGETGGTSLRNILVSLTDTTPKARRALAEVAKRIGQVAIATKDAKGQILPLSAILDQFARANLTAGEAIQIFGRRGGPGFATLLQQSLPSIVKLSAELHNAGGTAERVASQQFTGLNASFVTLKNSLTGLSIAVGNTGILGFLTAMVNLLRNVTQEMSKTNPGLILQVAKWLALAAVLGPIISLMGGVLRGMALLRIAIFGLTATGALAALTPAGIVGLVLVGLTFLAKHFLDVGLKAIEAQQRIDAFAASLGRLSRGELEAEVSALDTQIRNLEEQKSKIDAIIAKGAPKSEGVISQDFIEQSRAFNEARNAQDNVTASLERVRTAQRAATAELERRRVTDKQAADSAAEYDRQMKELSATLKSVTGAAGFGIDDKGQITAMVKRLRNVTDTLNLISDKTKGVEDRETQLLGPLQDAKQLWEEITQLIDQVGAKNIDPKIKEGAQRLKAAIDAASRPDPSSFEPLIRQVDNLLARIDAVRDSTDNVALRNQLLAPLYSEQAQLQAQVLAQITAQGGFLNANIRLVQKYNQLLRQQPPPNPLEKLAPDLLAQVNDFARRFEQARQALQAAGAAKSKEGVETAQAVIDQLTKEARGLVGMINDALKGNTTLSPEEKLAAWQQLLDILQKLGIQFDGATAAEERFLQTLEDIIRAGDAFGQFVDDIGAGSDGFDRLVRGATNVVDSFRQIKAAKDALGNFDFLKALPGIVGAIGGVVGAFGGFGDPEMKAIQQENNNRLRELRDALHVTAQGLALQAKAAAVLPKIDIDTAVARSEIRGGDKNKIIIEELDKQLKAMGSSMADLNQAAKDLGITLYKSNGQIDLDSLVDLEKAAKLSAQALVRFANTIDTQAALRDLKARLNKGSALDPTEQLTNELTTFVESLGPGLAQFVSGIDATTAEGREKLRLALLAMISAIESGTIKAADFGKFSSAEELISWVEKITGSMEALDESINATAVNVPAGFKIALDRFNALRPEAGTELNIKPNIDPVGLDDQNARLAEVLSKVQDTQTTRVVDSLTEILATLQEAGGAVPDSQATRGGSNSSAGSAAMVAAVNKLSGVAAASDAATRGVGDAVKALAAVLQDLATSDSTSFSRGVQADISRKNPDMFEPNTPTGDALTSRQTTVNYNFNFGDVNIKGADKTSREQWKDLKQVAREEASRRFGNPNRWGEVP